MLEDIKIEKQFDTIIGRDVFRISVYGYGVSQNTIIRSGISKEELALALYKFSKFLTELEPRV